MQAQSMSVKYTPHGFHKQRLNTPPCGGACSLILCMRWRSWVLSAINVPVRVATYMCVQWSPPRGDVRPAPNGPVSRTQRLRDEIRT